MYEKRISWKDVTESFLEHHNKLMRKPIERDSDKRVIFRNLPSWFRERGIDQDKAYELMPHFIMYFKINDKHRKHDEQIKPIWFHPNQRYNMSFKLDKGLKYAIQYLMKNE
ncbi:hypothetical protein [Terrihalobacillus insolitus]|uniref:hypothetical protein n=1 Tax=Terrihalobacillus insolitus TaxID=2950438 RepID=UPI0023412AE7|nr:hypothetical protein [Terrihalobacillus insolitus]MDC3413906.1 hypothetical protein [Terrihalobacillus insolitus]